MKNQILFEEITNRVIQKLEEGVIPWKRQWGFIEPAQNHFTEHIYRGVNSLLIFCEDFSTPYFATFKQIKANGGALKKGTKATKVYYFGYLYFDGEDKISEKAFFSLPKAQQENIRKVSYLKSMSVFNMQDVTGIEVKPSTNIINPENDTNEECHAFIDQLKDRPKIEFGGDQAYYMPSLDKIQMPEISSFTNSTAFYSVLFHELTHSSGHEKRLNRDGLTKMAAFGSPVYSKEELIAELGACFFNNFFGLECADLIENSAAYCQHWIAKLKGDCSLLMKASGEASKGFNFYRNQVSF